MNQAGVTYDPVDYARRPLTRAELDDIMGDEAPASVISQRSPSLRKLGIAHEDLGDEQAIEIMRENNAVIRRPVIVRGDRRIRGFDREAYEQLAREQQASGADGS